MISIFSVLYFVATCDCYPNFCCNFQNRMDAENPKYTEWRNPNFINHHGLNKDNCVDYISEAEHIFDPTCSNAVYNLQIKELDLKITLPEYLKKTPGIQYNVTHALEDLYVVQKQNRENENMIFPLNACYISEGNVYASPSCADIVKMRTMHSMYKLDKVFENLEDEIHFHPSRGYSFKKEKDIADSASVSHMEE